jgi:uncharacterized protein (DUF58 family)
VAGSDSVFTLVPRRRLVGLSFGAMQSSRRGAGTDVLGARPYLPGDDVRAIHWSASARWATARNTDEFILRERYADEAPRVIVVCDRRPSMALYAPPLPWLSKPEAIRIAAHLVADSTLAVRGFLGYLDLAEEEALWRPPRTQRALPELAVDRPFTAPSDFLPRVFDHLKSHRRAVPGGSFVFLLSDFLELPDDELWIDALDHRWDVVPVVIQDPVWEQSFPDVAGVVVPFADPKTGRLRPVRLSADEVSERRHANEQRLASLLARMRDLEIESVLVSSDQPMEVLYAFLEWADWRMDAKRRSW